MSAKPRTPETCFFTISRLLRILTPRCATLAIADCENGLAAKFGGQKRKGNAANRKILKSDRRRTGLGTK
jgi:hypothetical protein